MACGTFIIIVCPMVCQPLLLKWWQLPLLSDTGATQRLQDPTFWVNKPQVATVSLLLVSALPFYLFFLMDV